MNIIKLQGDSEKRKGIYYEYDADSKPLGEGGMGRVYKGFRVVERTGERMPVAIKVAYDNIPERVVERARREASIQLDNENLVRMFGFVETVSCDASGNNKVHYYMIMELLMGVTLEDLLFGIVTDQNGDVIPFASELHKQYQQDRNAAVVRIMKAVLSGLMALHDKGYIHRDVDPSNIIITVDEKIKLIDFGICKKVVSLESKDKSLTSTGEFIGKVNYAAPELVLGDVKSQDYTTDIYSMGVLLYQLCTGHLPFSGTDQEILSANLRNSLPLGDVKMFEFRRIVRKATEKSQSKRYASAAEMRVDIERVTANRKNLWDKKHKMITIGSLAAVMIIICIISLFKKPVEEELIIVEQPMVKADTDTIEVPVVVKQPTIQEIYSEAMLMLKCKDSIHIQEKGKEMLRVLVEDSLYEPAKMTYYLLLMNSNMPQDVKKGFYELEKIVLRDTMNRIAMYEYGLTLSKSNSVFSTPAIRQAHIGIEYNLQKANESLYRCIEIDTIDYLSVYWAFNNLMEMKLTNTMPSAEEKKLDKQLMEFYNMLNYRIDYHEDSISDVYRSAIEKDGKTLKTWGLLK